MKIMKKISFFKKSILWGGFIVSAGLGLSGCSQEAELEAAAENTTVIIDHEQEEFAYTTLTVSAEDVVQTTNLVCRYSREEETEITVSSMGRTVEEVYVEEGDSIVKGQLLAMLSGGDQEAKVRELEYKIERNQLLLSYTEMDEEYERSYRWWNYMYRTSMSKQDTEQLEQDLDAIGRRYRYLREDYQDAIDLDTAERNQILEEMEQCRIYADKTGVITYLNPYIQGNVIKEEKVFLRTTDPTQCFFESTQIQYADCFQEGQILDLTISSGQTPVYLEVTPMDMAHWEDKMLFKVVSGGSDDLSLNAMGRIPITVDSRTQVLAVPNECVHSTKDDQYYVYILNSNDVREVKWVEPGLRGDAMTEIVSGLEEGEQILLQ